MLCEKCKQNVANVHMQQTINGQETEFHLCTKCASGLDTSISFDNFFQGFLDSLITLQSSQAKNVTSEALAPMSVCPSCGLTYKDFINTRRLGCSQCYETFRKELVPIFKNIQGSSIHQGKFPKKSGGEILNRRKLENLKVNLSKAIQNEEYEVAATLRDEIRAIQGQLQQANNTPVEGVDSNE